MNLVIVIIGFILGAEYWKKRHPEAKQDPNWNYIATKRTQGGPITQPGAPTAQNCAITEAAYHQDPSIPYAPAFGASTIEYDGVDYLL